MESVVKERVYLSLIAILGIAFFLAAYSSSRTISAYQELYFDCENPYINNDDSIGFNVSIGGSGSCIPGTWDYYMNSSCMEVINVTG